MKLHTLFAVAIAFVAGSGASVQAASDIPAYITTAVADAGRPAADTSRDADRKPAEVLAFAGVKPGDKVVDLLPGSGYFTRIFSKIVGSKGAVFAYQPTEVDKFGPEASKPLQDLVADRAYGNVKLQHEPIAAFSVPEAVDLVWTSQNYHDLHDPWMGGLDVAKFNKAVFNALKPGGTFLVLDHVAADGSGLGATNTLHRIDPAAVKAEVTAAGFEFVGESKVLRNTTDDHTLKVFDKAIRGKTDQFIYKFRKPAH